MVKQIKKTTKKESDNVGVLFLLIIVLSLIFFGIGLFIFNKIHPKAETETSNGFVFVKSGAFWQTEIKNPYINQVYQLEFRYSPSQVKNVSVNGDPNKFFTLLNLNNLTGAYLTFDPNENLTFMTLAAADIARSLNTLHGIRLVAACTSNVTACSDRPIVTCQNQEGHAMVIYLKTDPVTKVTMEKNCLTIQGQGSDFIRAYNKLLFLWYSVL